MTKHIFRSIITTFLFSIFVYQIVVTTYYIKITTSTVQLDNVEDSEGDLTTTIFLEEEVEHDSFTFQLENIHFPEKQSSICYNEFNQLETYITTCTPPPEL